MTANTIALHCSGMVSLLLQLVCCRLAAVAAALNKKAAVESLVPKARTSRNFNPTLVDVVCMMDWMFSRGLDF